MTGDELKAWRERAAMSRAALGALLDVTDKTIQRAENLGAGQIGEKLANGVAALDRGEPVKTEPAPMPAAPKAKAKGAEEVEAHRLPRPYDFAKAPAFTEGARRFPASNEAYKADRYHDTRPASPGWQRVPGCIQIVHEAIPQPLPFEGPRWAGHLSIWAANGRVYDLMTGREIKRKAETRPIQAAPRAPFQKAPKKGR